MPKNSAITTKVPDDFFTGLSFWGELSKDQQKTVIQGTNRIHEAVLGALRLRAEAAREAATVREVLRGGGHWQKYVHSLGQSMRSTYRWLGRLDQLGLPPAVLDRAAARGIDVIDGRYFTAIKALPPPKQTDGNHLDGYLDRVAETAASRKAPELTASQAEIAAFRSVLNKSRRVGGKARTAWFLRLVGKLMAELGVPAQRIEPEAVPEGFKGAVGWPKGRPRVGHKALQE